jgi:hypothetical protein
VLLSVTQHVLRLGAVLALCALAAVACGAPDEEAKPRPLPDESRKLDPGIYRSEEFEPAFSFEVGEGWSVSAPEAYDDLRITQGHEDGGLGFANLRGRGSSSPPRRAPRIWWKFPRICPAGFGGIRT